MDIERRYSNRTMDTINSPPQGQRIASRAAAVELERRLALLRRVAVLCAILVLVITSLSAFIRLSKAGLSCADRPGCYGQNQRQLQQGLAATAGEDAGTAAARLAHRVVASAALLLVITMVAVCLTARPPMWREGRVALGLLALALFLAVLGRWSSNARVPAVAIGNLLGGFAMLALCWRVVRRGTRPATPWLRAWAGLGVALLLVQVGLGGLLSASYAAGSCAGLAECIAASASVPWSALDPWREPVLAFTPPVNPSGALAQTTHRLSGLAVLIVVLPLGIAAACKGRRRHGVLLLALLAAELALGLRMTGSVSLAPALAHNVVAALLLATAFDLTRGSGAARSP